MGVDRELARALGYFGGGVIALGAGFFALISFGTGNLDVIWLFLPLLVGYSVFIALFSIGLATYVFIRSRTSTPD
jgi:hypothetical protein